MSSVLAQALKGTLVVSRAKSWEGLMLRDWLRREREVFLRVEPDIPFRHSWPRFAQAHRIIVHWENGVRQGGAIIEEILDVAPRYDVGDKIIVVTSNPTREDIVYLNELGIKRIVRVRNRDRDLLVAVRELKNHLRGTNITAEQEEQWRLVIRAIDLLSEASEPELIAKSERALEGLRSTEYKPSARYHDALANIRFRQGNNEEAEALWLRALEQNSNYFRGYHGLVRLYRKTKRLRKAYALLQKLNELNRDNITRLTDMGEIHKELGQQQSAEHFFSSALERDQYHARALNGMAVLNFKGGRLETSRKLLSKSHLAYQVAKELNDEGIALVRQGRFQEALQHYTKAQFVIPTQEKGPLLLYNIGLCYSRWEKPEMAKHFLRLALIKEPKYERARKLLNSLSTIQGAAA